MIDSLPLKIQLVGAFDESLVVSGLNCRDKAKCSITDVVKCTATDYNVSNSAPWLVIRLLASAGLLPTKAIPGIQIDAVAVSWKWNEGLYNRYLQIKVSKNVVIALGTNTVSNYKELPISMLRNFQRPSPDPCDTHMMGDTPTISPVNRFKRVFMNWNLAEKYDFITIMTGTKRHWKIQTLGWKQTLGSLQYGNQWWGNSILKQ